MSKKIKTRFLSFILALVTIFTIVPSVPAMAAEDYSTGGWDQVQTTSTVVNSSGGTVGTVYAGEGVTILYLSGNNAYIEYSAGSSYKRGFISVFNLGYYGGFTQTAVGRVTSSSSTYYSPSTTHYAGSVSAGEYVAVLCKTSSWSYIEYNVSNGQRKRAFVPTSSLYCYSSDIRSNFYHVQQLGTSVSISSNTTVYAGPDKSGYPSIGTIYPSDNGNVWAYWTFYDGSGNVMKYVEYPTSSGVKYGYIYAN